MTTSHTFHIPVMGTAFTADSPLKVAHYGINTVIALADDVLLERLRKYYSGLNNLFYKEIKNDTKDYRADRITAYLNMVKKIASEKFEEFTTSTQDKFPEVKKYFAMLPDTNEMKKEFNSLISNSFSFEDLSAWLKENLSMGSIDVNIMTKVDKDNYKNNVQLPTIYNDAHAALRGFAESNVNGSLILSAGMNPRLYGYIESFKDFYPENNTLKKKVVLKVSDYRSALIQGKFLVKKGIWVSEFRVESGLNCGGHAFATEGYLLGPILNAGGRLGFSSYAVKLLSSNDEKEIDLIIKKLVELNEKRKSFEETILNNIDYKKIEVENENVIIYYHPSINEGLIGIIAARLKDIFNKPAIVITSSQNLLKGSARSISGFDIGLVFKNALDNKLIIKGGGHKMAAGFSLDKNNLKSFRKFIDNSYKKMCKNLNSNFLYESKISTSVFNSNFNVEINKLYPFGQGNTEPVFLFENLKIIKSKVLNNKHISNIFVSKSGFSIKSIAFNSINEAIGNYLLNYKKEINVIGYLNDNFWNNKKTLQLVVKDLVI